MINETLIDAVEDVAMDLGSVVLPLPASIAQDLAKRLRDAIDNAPSAAPRSLSVEQVMHVLKNAGGGMWYPRHDDDPDLYYREEAEKYLAALSAEETLE